LYDANIISHPIVVIKVRNIGDMDEDKDKNEQYSTIVKIGNNEEISKWLLIFKTINDEKNKPTWGVLSSYWKIGPH